MLPQDKPNKSLLETKISNFSVNFIKTTTNSFLYRHQLLTPFTTFTLLGLTSMICSGTENEKMAYLENRKGITNLIAQQKMFN